MKIGPFGTAKPAPVSEESTFFLAGKHFPIIHLNKHVFVTGQTGSGKTVTLRLLLQTLLPLIGTRKTPGGFRAVLYDPKSEMLPLFPGMGIVCPVRINNPFDTRSSAWAMAKDVTGPAAALETASILVPKKETMQPFFPDAVRLLLYGVMLSLHLLCPGEWTLRHVCLILRSKEYMQQLLSQSSATRYIVSLVLQAEGKMLQSILATVQTTMLPYEIVAALWHRAEMEGQTFSLHDFLKNEEVLLLGNFEEARSATDAIHQALVQRLTGLLLSQKPEPGRRCFLVFDELREAGELSGLRSFLLKSRYYGGCAILATQSKSGLDAVYTREVADELIDQCGFRVFLKSEGETAAWASRQFGESESIALRANTSVSYGGETITQSQGSSEDFRKREVVMAGELMTLPPASAREGVHNIVKTPWGAFRSQVDFVPLLTPEDPDTAGFVRRPPDEEFLEEFTAAELLRFGLTRMPEDASDINWSAMRHKLFPRDKRRKNEEETS